MGSNEQMQPHAGVGIEESGALKRGLTNEELREFKAWRQGKKRFNKGTKS